MKILLIEDDAETALFISKGMNEHGHRVEHVANGLEGLSRAMTEDFDLLVLDRMLPGLDGLSVVKRLRTVDYKAPVLFLSNLGGLDDRVNGLEAGGDDYLPKPFAFSELLARANALIRRPPPSNVTTTLQVADLCMDLIRREVRRGGSLVTLQPREFLLLEYLMRHAGHVVTRTMLLEGVWDYHFDPKTNIVETHISRLRSKLSQGDSQDLIHTIRGVGYRLSADPVTC
jgi:two-component system OmpR family response regulator